jgi:hypothetical protein
VGAPRSVHSGAHSLAGSYVSGSSWTESEDESVAAPPPPPPAPRRRGPFACFKPKVVEPPPEQAPTGGAQPAQSARRAVQRRVARSPETTLRAPCIPFALGRCLAPVCAAAR